jgi:[ribosomal protein S18]-alanine N-acetyltransferase
MVGLICNQTAFMNQSFSIRNYQSSDQPFLIELIRSNVPRYFAESEVDDFVHYLESELENYWVLEVEDQIVGCGGVNFLDTNKARISWDMIHPDFQGIGLGKKLLNFRFDFLTSKGFDKVDVRTSQFSYLFYQKNGFNTLEIKPNYWFLGYDLYHMERDL